MVSLHANVPFAPGSIRRRRSKARIAFRFGSVHWDTREPNSGEVSLSRWFRLDPIWYLERFVRGENTAWPGGWNMQPWCALPGNRCQKICLSNGELLQNCALLIFLFFLCLCFLQLMRQCFVVEQKQKQQKKITGPTAVQTAARRRPDTCSKIHCKWITSQVNPQLVVA